MQHYSRTTTEMSMNIYRYALDSRQIFTLAGLLVASDFTRVVHGGRGAYVEFSDDEIIKTNLFRPPDSVWRITNQNAYYVEYRTRCAGNVKFSFQRKEVNYADYHIGRWYAAPQFLRGFVVDGIRPKQIAPLLTQWG